MLVPSVLKKVVRRFLAGLFAACRKVASSLPSSGGTANSMPAQLGSSAGDLAGLPTYLRLLDIGPLEMLVFLVHGDRTIGIGVAEYCCDFEGDTGRIASIISAAYHTYRGLQARWLKVLDPDAAKFRAPLAIQQFRAGQAALRSPEEVVAQFVWHQVLAKRELLGGDQSSEGPGGAGATRRPPSSETERSRLRREINQASGQSRLSLEWLTELDPHGARCLACWGWKDDRGRRRLILNGLPALDPEAARYLSRWGEASQQWRQLVLDGLTTLDPETARGLALWGKGKLGVRCLSLGGLISLTLWTARHLSAWGADNPSWCEFVLGITALDAACAREIVEWGTGSPAGPRRLALDRLAELPADAAHCLAGWFAGNPETCRLSLGGLARVTAETARGLVRWGAEDEGPRSLHLDGLRALSPETTRLLVEWGSGHQHRRSLFLNGLTALGPESARCLAAWCSRQPGSRCLHLDGLAALDLQAARGLTTWGGAGQQARWLFLRGLREPEPEVRERLAEWASCKQHYLIMPAACGELRLDWEPRDDMM